MAEKTLRYSTVLFDWGDTVMRDRPEITTPMVEWATVEVVDGIAEVLDYLKASGRRIVLATSASVSDESQIRGALARGGLETYFSRIYCFRNTNLPKNEEFYLHILQDLSLPASEAVMIGDGFEKDVQIPSRLGMFAIWFNPRSNESSSSDGHITVHSLREIIDFFESL